MVQYTLYCASFLLILSNISARDPVSDQLLNYKQQHPNPSTIRTGFGAPISDIISSLTAGPRGPTLLQDVVFLDSMSHFDRERIPGRVVHEKGSGAFGYFQVTKDITRYTKAKLFSAVGKRTRIAIRMSLATGEKGTPETVRDPRGFAMKFYTEEGIWDLVCNNSPIFFMKDAMLQPLVVHALLRNPVTNVKDPDALWDLLSLLPESTYQTMILFSDKGIPDGYRHMDAYGAHAFKMVNARGQAIYVKFHVLTDQGIRNLSPDVALNLTATNPDYATRDLYNAIARGNFPSWTMYIQVMTFQQAETFRWNPFDVTKIWPEEDYPLKEVGKLYLTENPKNYFTDVEQAGFSPAHMVPGIEPSPDKMLQGRLFAYSDTQRHRLGPNHLQLPVNCPFKNRGVTNYQRDGASALYNQNGAPSFYPNSFGGPQNLPSAASSKFNVSGDVERYNFHDKDNYSQASMFWNKLSAGEQNRMVENISENMKFALPYIQRRAVGVFRNVNETFADKLAVALRNAQI